MKAVHVGMRAEDHIGKRAGGHIEKREEGHIGMTIDPDQEFASVCQRMSHQGTPDLDGYYGSVHGAAMELLRRIIIIITKIVNFTNMLT